MGGINLKKILVTKSSMPPMDEYVDEIKKLWDHLYDTDYVDVILIG